MSEFISNLIEVEAETVEEARQKVKSQIPDGYAQRSEQIISRETQKSVNAVANTTEEAFAKARGKIPSGVKIIGEKELNAPERKIITVEAFDEQSAKSSVRSEAKGLLGDKAEVKNVELLTMGSKGFLGMGKKPNVYQAEIYKQASVRITYKTMAKISVEIRKVPTTEERQLAEAIVAELESKDVQVSTAAVKKLEQMDITMLGAASELVVTPLLIVSLGEAAISVLIRIGNPAAQVLKELVDSGSGLRFRACIALAKMGDPTHTDYARDKLNSFIRGYNEYDARAAIKAWVQIGGEGVDHLIHTLRSHPNEHLRAEAAMALGNIGDKRAIPALTQALQDPSWQNVRPIAESALRKLRRGD